MLVPALSERQSRDVPERSVFPGFDAAAGDRRAVTPMHGVDASLANYVSGARAGK